MKRLARNLFLTALAGVALGGNASFSADATPSATRQDAAPAGSERFVGSEEVRQAIVKSLREQGVSESQMPSADDIKVGVPVRTMLADPGLIVQRTQNDSVRRVTLFRMWASKERKAVPFFVSVRLHDEARTVALHIQESVPTGKLGLLPQKKVSVRPPAIVKPGRRATLLIQAAGMRITSDVMPLEAGAQGQEIRVRSVATDKVVRARVVATDMLLQSISGESAEEKQR